MANGCLRVLPEIASQPAETFAFHHVVAADVLLDILDRCSVSTQDDLRVRLDLPDQSRHLASLDHIGGNRADPHRIVALPFQLGDEPPTRWEIEQRYRR